MRIIHNVTKEPVLNTTSMVDSLAEKYPADTSVVLEKAKIDVIFEGDDTVYKPSNKDYHSVEDIKYGTSCKVLMEHSTTPFKVYVTIATDEYVKEVALTHSSVLQDYRNDIAENIDNLLYIQYVKDDGSTGVLLPLAGQSKMTETQVVYSFAMPYDMMVCHTAFIINSNINTLRTAVQQNQMVKNYMASKITYSSKNILEQADQNMKAKANMSTQNVLSLLK